MPGVDWKAVENGNRLFSLVQDFSRNVVRDNPAEETIHHGLGMGGYKMIGDSNAQQNLENTTQNLPESQRTGINSPCDSLESSGYSIPESDE